MSCPKSCNKISVWSAQDSKPGTGVGGVERLGCLREAGLEKSQSTRANPLLYQRMARILGKLRPRKGSEVFKCSQQAPVVLAD